MFSHLHLCICKALQTEAGHSWSNNISSTLIFSVLCAGPTDWPIWVFLVFNHFGFLEYMHEKINMHLNCISKNKADAFRKRYNSPCRVIMCRWVACFNHCFPRLDASRTAHLNGVSTQLVACRRVNKQKDCGLIWWLLGRSWFFHHTVTARSEAVCWCWCWPWRSMLVQICFTSASTFRYFAVGSIYSGVWGLVKIS